MKTEDKQEHPKFNIEPALMLHGQEPGKVFRHSKDT